MVGGGDSSPALASVLKLARPSDWRRSTSGEVRQSSANHASVLPGFETPNICRAPTRAAARETRVHRREDAESIRRHDSDPRANIAGRTSPAPVPGVAPPVRTRRGRPAGNGRSRYFSNDAPPPPPADVKVRSSAPRSRGAKAPWTSARARPPRWRFVQRRRLRRVAPAASFLLASPPSPPLARRRRWTTTRRSPRTSSPPRPSGAPASVPRRTRRRIFVDEEPPPSLADVLQARAQLTPSATTHKSDSTVTFALKCTSEAPSSARNHAAGRIAGPGATRKRDETSSAFPYAASAPYPERIQPNRARVDGGEDPPSVFLHASGMASSAAVPAAYQTRITSARGASGAASARARVWCRRRRDDRRRGGRDDAGIASRDDELVGDAAREDARVGAGGVRGGDGRGDVRGDGRGARDVDILDILAVVPDVDPAASDHPRGGAIDGDAIDHQLVRVEGHQADVAEPGGRGATGDRGAPDDVSARAARQTRVELEVLPANLGEPRRSRRRGRDGGSIDASTSIASGWGSDDAGADFAGVLLRGGILPRLRGARFKLRGGFRDLDTPTASGPGSGQPARTKRTARCSRRPRDRHSCGRGTMASVDPPPRRRRNVALVLAFIVSCAVCFVLGVYQGSARDDALGVREILKLPEGCPPRDCPPRRECPTAPAERLSDLAECPPCVKVECRACPACDPCPAPAIAERTEREDAGANNRSVVVVPATSSDADVDVEDDKIVSAKDESETRERKSEKTTTESVRVDDVAGAVGGDECPVCEGCPRYEGERAPTRQPAGTRPRGRGRGWGRGRAGARPATRVLSVPLRDRRVPNTSRANEPSNSETTLVRGDSRSIVSSSRTNVAERAGAGRVVHDVGVRMTRRARGVHQSTSTILKSSNSPSSGRHSPRPIARRLSRSSSTASLASSGSWSWGQDGSSASMSSRSVSACVFSRSPSRSPRQAGSVIRPWRLTRRTWRRSWGFSSPSPGARVWRSSVHTVSAATQG